MLTTKRLILRLASDNDLDDLFDIYSDPRAMRYWSSPPHKTLDETRETLARMVVASDTTPTYFVIEHQSRAIWPQ